jgi:TetR/AcrR family transcriptional repressor of nem operon
MLAEMVGAVTLSRAVADPAQSDAILERARASVIARFRLEDVQ